MSRSLSSPPFTLLLLSTALAFGGYALLLPVVPLWVARGGAGEFGAGLTTGVLMAVTVGVQLLVPLFLRRLGHRTVLVTGSLLLAAPAPLLAVSSDLVWVLALSAARGVGFGLVTVAGSALVAELVEAPAHGRASARYGYASGLPQLALLPVGVVAVDLLGFDGVFLAAGIAPALGALVAAFVQVPAPSRGPTPAPHREETPGHHPRYRVPAAPIAAMLVCSIAQGGMITFAPLVAPQATAAVPVALFATAATAMLGRGLAGTLTDRNGRPTALLPLGCLLTGAGTLAVVAAPADGVFLVAGAALVGTGFGLVQNSALVALFTAAGPLQYGAASAAWNISYDAGTGLGASGLGALAEPFGFTTAFATAATVALVVAALLHRRTPRGE